MSAPKHRHRLSVGSSMKRDTRCVVGIGTEHPQIMEEANLKASYTPGRSGGTFGLPLGAKLIVPENLCTRREHLTCSVAPPYQRWKHRPSFPGEHVTSEIFTLSGNLNMKQRSVILILPYNPPPHKFLELNVKGLWKDDTAWVDVGFIPKELPPVHPDDAPQPCVELQIGRLGTFVVTFRSRTDEFQMTPNGGLYHSRLNRNLSVRFPKKAVDTTVSFILEITPIPEDRVAISKEFFFKECGDLLNVTEFIDFGPDTRCDFRRMATIKLPLPAGVEVEGESSEEIAVLHKEPGGWEWVTSKYKFTRNSVTFDVKNPSKFCVVKSKPQRQKKMQEAVTVLEERMGKETGQVNVFLSLRPKSWMAVLEVFPQEQVDDKLHTREAQGFSVVSKVEQEERPVTSQTSFSRRPPPPKEFRPKQLASFELYDGLTWAVTVTDDLEVSSDCEFVNNEQLVYFKYLKESYRCLELHPATEEERELRGTIVLTPVGVADPSLKEKLTLTFHVDIPERTVRDFFYVPEPEPVPEPQVKPKLDLPLLPEPEPLPRTLPRTERPRTFSLSALERLTQPVRRPNVRLQLRLRPGVAGPSLYEQYRRIGFVRPPITAEKEAKVLTGKSLMTLSRVVNEGLTLAVHLELPDSTITGIGFDALANGRSMAEVGYKILLYWKRTRKDKRDGAVQHLIQGLRSMGKNGVADVVEERHRENKELTMDCFLMAAVNGINIAS